MSYRIEVASPARQEIAGLPGHIRSQARQLIEELGRNPFPGRAKELRDKPHIYRIWLAGRWRIVYFVDDELQIVRILRVRRKEEIGYEDI